MTEILSIPAPMARDVWITAGPLLAESIAMSRGRYEPRDVLEFCENGQMQLWLMATDKIAAAAVTEIVNYPRKRVVRVVFAGGSLAKEWCDEFDAALEAFGRSWGCSATEASGRRGWKRLLDAEQLAVFVTREYDAPETVSTEMH